MHLLQIQERSLDEEAGAVDLAQSPAELVVLSFTDSDLAVTAAAHAASAASLPGLRLASLAQLKHPYSVDLFVERLARTARFVLVRLLGGLDYWRYGVDELAAAARRHGFALAVVPGDGREDARLDRASTLPVEDLRRLWSFFQEGGARNLTEALRFMAARAGCGGAWAEPLPVPCAGLFTEGCRTAPADAPHALVVFYRSVMLAADTAPIVALADALAARGASVSSVFVTSLKDPAADAWVSRHIAGERPDVILNTTAFSARKSMDRDPLLPAGEKVADRPDEGRSAPCSPLIPASRTFSPEGRRGTPGGSEAAVGGIGQAGTVLDEADVPVLQVMLVAATREQWDVSARGLGAADLAMNVVLPEVDGRIIAGALSFKAEAERRDDLEFTRLVHRPEPDRVAHAADLAMAWARLGRTPRHARRIACVLSDYPGRDGRTGYAVGLDTPASVVTIATHLAAAGFAVGPVPDATLLMRRLTEDRAEAVLTLADYRAQMRLLPAAFAASVEAAWGDPADDPALGPQGFAFRIVRLGAMLVSVQPDRGAAANRRADYHDAALPPRHAYVAFYLWLRTVERIDALIHLGTHGTLEWLPGKAVALGQACGPEAVLGPVPVVYPFIVNNPGEAAQAKRRIGAVTIGHMTPPLMAAGHHGAAQDLETLFDEYAQAQTLDPRRARLLAQAILAKAAETGIAVDAGFAPDETPEAALARLDAWLCDIKEMRIGDGLHVFGQSPGTGLPASDCDGEAALAACGPSELRGLLAALDGRFVAPGPAGAPARGRMDVLPTGRNLFSVDPRAVPTRAAYEIGRKLADAVMTRYAQDHGDWPRHLVMDLWGSATMRTGGDDLAQAFVLIGVRPRWDAASARVLGFDILPQALLDWPRVDVTLRISGLFRDTFPDQIALFDAASRAVADLDEDDQDNALAQSRRRSPDAALASRIFGAAPGSYGIGLGRTIVAGGGGDTAELGEAYLAATSHAYGAGAERPAAADFRTRVEEADLYLHVQDLPGTDLLDAATFADHEGGFAAAAAALGRTPALYHADATRTDGVAVRTLGEELARVVRGRATNPAWIAGQMRHGHRGAAEIAETVDNLFAFAATTGAVPSRHFDLLFDATCAKEAVRDFLIESNPAAARAIAERFTQAMDRDFWTTRRNSSAAILADMLGNT